MLFNQKPIIKLIYLDIDGVLNRYSRTLNNGEKQLGTTNKFWGLIGMDYEKVQFLNRILEECNDTYIIISSSWSYWNDETCRTKNCFIKNDFKYIDRIIGRIERIYKSRGLNILHHYQEFNKNYNIIDFLIIDDEDFDIIGEDDSLNDNIRDFFKNRLIKPNLYDGLEEKHINNIIQYFKRNNMRQIDFDVITSK